MVFFMGSAEVHHGQHHEDERLQRDHQNMEDRPRHVQCPLHVERQQCDEDEHHLTGIHVAEQTQSQTQRLGQQTEDFEEQVEGDQRPVLERGEAQFLGEAPTPLTLTL